MPRRKSICKKNLWGRSTSSTRAKCRYAAGISFPGRSSLTSRNLRAQSTARPRYPFGILFNLSLSLYRIWRRSTEKRSLFFIRLRMHAWDRLVYFSDTIATISLAEAHSSSGETKLTKLYSVSYCEKPFLRHFWKIAYLFFVTLRCKNESK